MMLLKKFKATVSHYPDVEPPAGINRNFTAVAAE